EVNGALLTNFGTITGTTDVNFGGQAQGIGTYGLVNITTGGLFQPGAGSNPPQLNFASVSGIAGNGTIDNATAGGFMDLFVTGPSTSTFAGTIQNTIGLLQLFLRNNASLTLLTSSQPAGGQSVNTYNGGSVISSGCTLTIGAVGALPTGGSVSNNGAFIINADSTCGQLGAGGTTTINTGATLHISPSVGINSQLHIIFNGTGKLDLTNNELLTNQTPAGIRALLSSGVIFSSSAGANTALGYADQGGGVVEVKYTLRGDANLDGKVDVGDLGALATAYGSSSGASWVQGDFNYDGAVNVGDLGALATNYGLSLAGGTAAAAADPSVLPLARISAQAVISPVPEPAGLALIGMAVVGALKRRSRKV
ncbi:MAG TPA: PEP-CTERM sorting domain-containing protein, partial [Tepidisphaeraceae bacterium]|nr:PEP-CTERM sorting domain-containing protein [Tepidisphaeraceae bacterium]